MLLDYMLLWLICYALFVYASQVPLAFMLLLCKDSKTKFSREETVFECYDKIPKEITFYHQTRDKILVHVL